MRLRGASGRALGSGPRFQILWPERMMGIRFCRHVQNVTQIIYLGPLPTRTQAALAVRAHPRQLHGHGRAPPWECLRRPPPPSPLQTAFVRKLYKLLQTFRKTLGAQTV